MYKIDNNAKIPLHIQLYNALKIEIKTKLKVGDKLPSIRKIALEYNLSKTTVSNAYAQLYAEGYIESRPKSGYYVSDLLDIKFTPLVKQDKIEQKKSYIYDFSPTMHDSSYFPIKIWRRLSYRALNLDLNFASYTDGQGEFGLREVIANYLKMSRGVKAKASNIVVTSSFINAISLVAKLLKSKKTTFAIESPGYYIAENIFREFGFKINKISLNIGGIDLEELKKSNSKIVYITPSHQYPTGIIMPVHKRQKLLKIMSNINGYIIEDDYDSELNYQTRPIPSLHGLDNSDIVIYVGTFAKALSPALRVTYLHLPDSILKLYKKSYDSHFSNVNIQIQKTLELFMKEGYFDRHLRKIRTQNKKKHNLMLECLKKELANSYEIVSKGAGIAILIYPINNFNWQKFKKLSQENSIKIYLASLCNSSNFEAIRLGFGGFSLTEIPNAIKAFAKVWWECLESV